MRQVLRHTPAILHETAGVMMAEIVRVGAGLIVQAVDADEKVRKLVAGFLPGKSETSVGFRVRVDVDLFVTANKAGLDRMGSGDLRKDVVPGISIVVLREIRNGDAHDEGIEDHVFNAFILRKKRNDTGRSDTGLKTL